MNFTVPTQIRKLTDRYKDILSTTGLSYCYFCTFLYSILFGYNLSETVKNLASSCSLSSLSRAVKKFDGNRFMRRYRTGILNKVTNALSEPGRYIYVVDDTPNEKYAKFMHKMGVHRSHKNKMYTGQRILLICLLDTKTQKIFPLAYAFCTNKESEGHVKCTDLADQLLKIVLEAGFPPLHVAFDSWFDSKDLIMNAKNKGFNYCGEMKTSRLFLIKKQILTRKDKHNVYNNKYQYLQIFQGKIKKCPLKLKFILVFDHSNSKKPRTIYATTDLSLTGAQIWEKGRQRWKIECAFRDLKQNLFFGQHSILGESGTDLSVCLPIALFSSLQLDNFWNSSEKDTIGQKLERFKYEEEMKSLNFIQKKPKEPKVLMGLNRKSHFNRKPKNIAADGFKEGIYHAA